MKDQLELARVTSSMGIGFLADRGLMALFSSEHKVLPADEREVFLQNKVAIHSLFVAEPEDLVSSENMAYLEAAQSGWYKRLEETVQPPTGRKTANRLRDWAICAEGAAEKLAEGQMPDKKGYECLVSLLQALSTVTLEYVSEAQAKTGVDLQRWLR